jgi:hypothetical protein
VNERGKKDLAMGKKRGENVTLVEDLEDKRENMPPPPPPVIWTATPHPAPVLWELIPIEEPTPLYPGVELEGEDDLWYIPPVMRRWIHAIDKFSIHRVDPLPEYVEDVREDLLASVHRDDLAADGLEDKMWVNLGVAHR